MYSTQCKVLAPNIIYFPSLGSVTVRNKLYIATSTTANYGFGNDSKNPFEIIVATKDIH